MTELPPDAKEALRLARRAAEPSAEQLERVAQSLRATLFCSRADPPASSQVEQASSSQWLADGGLDPQRLESLGGAGATTQTITWLGKLAPLGKALSLSAVVIGAGTVATWICLQAAGPGVVSLPRREVPPVTAPNPPVERVEHGKAWAAQRAPAAASAEPTPERAQEVRLPSAIAKPSDSSRTAVAVRQSRVRNRKDVEKAEMAPLIGGRKSEAPSAAHAGALSPSTRTSIERAATASKAQETPVPGVEAGRASREPMTEVDGPARDHDMKMTANTTVKPELVFRPAVPSTRPEAAESESLAREIPIIARAHALLTEDKPKKSLRLLESYLHEFPHGTLRVEALATRALCYCQLGAADEARAALRKLAADPAAAPHLARLRASCRPVLDEADL